MRSESFPVTINITGGEMKRDATLLLMMVLALTTLCSAQSTTGKSTLNGNATADKQSVEQTILSREKEAWNAIIKDDGAAFKKMHTNDAVIVSPQGVARIVEFASVLSALNALSYVLND